MKRISIYIPETFLAALNKLAKERGTKTAHLIRTAVYEFLKAAGALCLLLVVGCGGGSGGSSENYSNKISEWRSRENECADIKTECRFTGDIIGDIFAIRNQLPQFTYQKEDGDYWNTSCETLKTPIGECDDFSPMICRALSDSCLQEHYNVEILISIIDLPGENHMVCVVKHGEKTYEVEDGMILSGGPDKILASFSL